MRQAACFLPPSLSPTAPVGQPQLSSGPFPPTAAACAVSVILPSDAPPTATASLASDAPRHGFLHVLAVEPPSGPYSPPLLSAFLPRPHTARPSAALLWTSASFRPSAPTAVAGLLSWLGSVARDPSFRASPSSSSAVAAVSACSVLGTWSPSSAQLGTWSFARVSSSQSCCGLKCSCSSPCSGSSLYSCLSPCSRSLAVPLPVVVRRPVVVLLLSLLVTLLPRQLGLRILFGPADARAFSSLPREFFPPTPATSLITSPASPFLGAKRPFVAQVAVVIAA
ncbi:unnamed protein product [Closterium sp. NIES-65]|nr:unnamed protein product [Closterium sp. NIES-65]